ncbi:hypothetical protein FACS1894190_02590 [Spirochaetia bacterium]|nr:hypothetical protein FACS1894190_02590 [Spirochaetia bacterium]
MQKNVLVLEEYFNQAVKSNGMFIIPPYQRAYKWGVPNKNINGDCMVGILIKDLLESFEKSVNTEYFIQGITVSKDNGNIILIDGQQRTTTLYLLLKYLNYEKITDIRIKYEVRTTSDEVLMESTIDNDGKLCFIEKPGTDYGLQDIFYFKKAVQTFHNIIINYSNNKNIDFKILKEKILIFVLKNVKLFYIEIDNKNATKIFSMLNGQKAIMKDDELIKADLFSKALRQNLSQKNECEIDNIRSRYAREWDKWLYWWNKRKVKEFFNNTNSMGLLLEYYYKINSNSCSKPYNYTNFSDDFISRENPKILFNKIRALQKTFEALYNEVEVYNLLGLALKTNENKETALRYFIENKNNKEALKEYAKWILVTTHENIINNRESEMQSDARNVFDNLNAAEVYGENNDAALKQLLRKNVELDTKLERKFDFSLYGSKSLEHIFPKAWEKEAYSKLRFDAAEDYSVNSIGNLVLLKSKDNSYFGALSFEEKKKKYFDMENVVWSLKLLHSVAIFSKYDKWDEESIKENQKDFLSEFNECYGVNKVIDYANKNKNTANN